MTSLWFPKSDQLVPMGLWQMLGRLLSSFISCLRTQLSLGIFISEQGLEQTLTITSHLDMFEVNAV